MGWKYEVYAWVNVHDDEYTYKKVCGTNWLIEAVVKAIVAKRSSGCIKFEWR